MNWQKLFHLLGSAGDNVTLNGNFFTNEADDLQIKFDDVTCIVRTASESSVTCTLGQREAGTITPQVAYLECLCLIMMIRGWLNISKSDVALSTGRSMGKLGDT